MARTTQLILSLIIICFLFAGCTNKKKNQTENNDIIYQYENFKLGIVNHNPKNFHTEQYKIRMRLNKINDSTIYIIQIIDSVKIWPSHIFVSARHREEESMYYSKELDSLYRLEDSVYYKLKNNILFDTTINRKTKIVFLHPGYENDNLIYNTKKKYNKCNIYSFYNDTHVLDAGYEIFLCDSIGVVAMSGCWGYGSILDKIINNDKLNSKWQVVKTLLLADSLFFPHPIDTNLITKVKFVQPIL